MGVLFLKIVCWTYLLFVIVGRVTGHDKNISKNYNGSKFIDYLMIMAMIAFLLIIYKT